jgi:hypothetical protein
MAAAAAFAFAASGANVLACPAVNAQKTIALKTLEINPKIQFYKLKF